MRWIPGLVKFTSASALLLAGCDASKALDPLLTDETAAARASGGTDVAAPTEALATPVSDTQINLVWKDNSTNETKFEIYRSTPTVQFSPTILLASPAANSVTYADAGVTKGLEYCYMVRAVRVTGNKTVPSTMSNTTCELTPPIPPPAPLIAPSNTVIGLYSANEMTILWQDNSSNETAFEIHRSETGPTGAFVLRATAYANSTGAGDAGLTSFAEYCYKVRAVYTNRNVVAVSPFSNVACGQAVPAPAYDATARPETSNLILVQWYATGRNFRVEQSTNGGTSWSVATGTMVGLSSFQTATQPEQNVCYRVINYLETYNAAPSNTACTAAPAAPTGVTATTLQSGVIRLTWNDNSSVEDGYEVKGWVEDCYRDWDGNESCYGWSEYVVAILPPNSTSYESGGVDLSVRAMKHGGHSSRGTP